MSVSYLRRCPCGLLYKVIEEDNTYVTTVNGKVEEDCPKCDEPLSAGKTLEDVKPLVSKDGE